MSNSSAPFVFPQGPIPVRGQAKRVREQELPTRTSGQAAADPFVTIVERERARDKAQGTAVVAPNFRRNPNQDFRYPVRSPSPIRSPPGQWVPDVATHSVGMGHARAAADSLPWADSRAERRLAAAAGPIGPPVVYANRVRLKQGEAVWSQLDNCWVYPTGAPSRITRSRSPHPRQGQYHDARHQGPSVDNTRFEPCD